MTLLDGELSELRESRSIFALCENPKRGVEFQIRCMRNIPDGSITLLVNEPFPPTPASCSRLITGSRTWKLRFCKALSASVLFDHEVAWVKGYLKDIYS